MVRQRVIETTEGIQDAFDVEAYDRWMRNMRRRGWVETPEILRSGIATGHALEISPGPGYLGLDWLTKTKDTRLTGLDISDEMLRRSRANASSEGLDDRVDYVHGDACAMPFADGSFDGVFANGGLHEWSEPVRVFDEIARVLAPGGRFCVTDLRRDMNPLLKSFLWLMTRERTMRAGLLSSIRAAYTADEARQLVNRSELPDPSVRSNAIGLTITGARS